MNKQKLQELGYKVNYDQDGYSVWYKEEFVYGAGVKLPRERKLHWRHAQQNRKDFCEYGWREAEKDAIKRNLITQ